MILAIDPGNVQSAYVLMLDDGTHGICKSNIVPNGDLHLGNLVGRGDTVVIEMVASYGMPVGREVFDTCVWIGRFTEQAKALGCNVQHITRNEIKNHICHSSRAKDSNIRQALIDRFGVVGTKKNPGWFYGFKRDMWAAYAVGVTWIDKNQPDVTVGIGGAL